MTDKINKTEDISEKPQTIKFYSAEEELSEDILNIETEEILAEPDHFYNSKNLELLKKSINQLETGKGQVHELTSEYNAETLAAIAEIEEILTHPEKHQFYSSIEEMFKNVLEKNISANPDLPAEFVKDILIAKNQSKIPFDMELEE